MTQRTHVEKRRGFTLVELLIVIGIIALLITILIPVVGKIRKSARNTANMAFLNQLERAIDGYYQDFHAYPGPLSNSEIWNTPPVPAGVPSITFSSSSTDYDTGLTLGNITMSENLVLGLLGGLRMDTSVNPAILTYDPMLIGNGPASLNPAVSKRYNRYMDSINLSMHGNAAGKKTGHFEDNNPALDSIIPEFVDTDSDPMPILYLRAKIGAKTTLPPTSPPTILDNTIVTYDTSNATRIGQYDMHQIIGYTGATPAIGVGRDYKDQGLGTVSFSSATITAAPNTAIPQIDPYYYFRNSSFSSPAKISTALGNAADPRNDVPQRKDTYILIMAGPDRVYGTADDITNFGVPGQ